MSRVRGRTRAQYRADQAAVREAICAAVEAMVSSGALHGCGEHVHPEVDACARCRWVNEQLGCQFEDEP